MERNTLPTRFLRLRHGGAVQETGSSMTDRADHEEIMTAIARGVEVARNNPLSNTEYNADTYIAWCALQELRRAGWSIQRLKSN